MTAAHLSETYTFGDYEYRYIAFLERRQNSSDQDPETTHPPDLVGWERMPEGWYPPQPVLQFFFGSGPAHAHPAHPAHSERTP